MKAQSILPQGFYVYTHHRADTGEIFYVGKGKANRAWDVTGRSKHWQNIVKKHGLSVKIVKHGMLELDALAAEVLEIQKYGRKDKCQGPLINKTDGGEGVSGRIIPDHERAARGQAIRSIFIKNPELRKKYGEASRSSLARPETKAKLSESMRRGYAEGRFNNKSRWEKIAKSWDTCARQKRIEAMRRAAATPEGKAKRSIASKAAGAKRAKSLLCQEMMVCFFSLQGAVDHLRQNGWPKAVKANICSCCTGKLSKAYGMTWQYCD